MKTFVARWALLLVIFLGEPALVWQVAVAQDVKVLTNHLGYEPKAAKRAVVLGRTGDDVTAFRVVDEADGKEVLSGTAVKVGPVDRWRDWVFWTLDFSPIEREGNYRIECTTDQGTADSFPFAIQRELLERNTLSNVIYYFKSQRNSGQREEADYHLKFEDSSDPTKTLDLHGGWADATGDYGKHLSHLTFSTYFNPQHIPLTTWVMLKANEELQRRGGKSFRLFKQRLLDEAMFGADYLCRSKSPTGSFFRSVDDPDSNHPEKRFVAKDGSGGIIKKTKNPNPLQEGDMSAVSGNFLYEIGFRSGGGVAIAALALASRSGVSGEYTSAQYLDAAREAYAFLKKNNLYYTNDGKENIVDDYCILLAASELYQATKEEQYAIDAETRAKSLVARVTAQGYWRANDGDRPFFHAADAGLPVVALLNYYPIADEALQKSILATVKKSLEHELDATDEVANPFGYARQLVQSKDGNRRTAFFFPHDTDAAPWWQGENARLGSLATAARMASGYFKDDPALRERLEAYATNQLNWILGLNPFDCCMLHGSGRNSLYYNVENTYAYCPAPGGICNGITAGFTNPDDIDFAPSNRLSDAWRWAEQWLPHATWYLYAVCVGDRADPPKLSATQVDFKVLAVASRAKDHLKMIAAATPMLEKMAAESHFAIDFSDDATLINPENLAKYQVFVQLQEAPFDMTADEQRALQKFVEQGHGWVGIHAAGLTGKKFLGQGTDYWQWFEDFLGGITYSPHPKFQPGVLLVEDRTHPATRHLPARMEISDEWYEFNESPRPRVHVLATADESTYKQNKPMGDHPLVWTNEKFHRMIYIAIGHDAALCDNADFQTLVRDAIVWAAEK